MSAIRIIDNHVELDSIGSNTHDQIDTHITANPNGAATGQLSFWDGAKWGYTETSELFWDDTNKRFGVGTSTPNNKLHIAGMSATDAILSEVGYDMDYVAKPGAGDWSIALGANAGNLGEGNYCYIITFVTPIGETEACTSKSIATDATHHRVDITLPVSSDSRVTQRKIYRTPVSVGTAYGWNAILLTTINNNVDTDYEDNVADVDLTGVTPFFQPNKTNKGVMKNGSTVLITDPQVTILGVNAGNPDNATGGRAIYVGSSAGQAVTTGKDNHIFGYKAGQGITTGNSNIMMGTSAGTVANPTSSILIGQLAGSYGSGTANNFMGYTSGYATSTQTGINYNVANGYNALRNIKSGASLNLVLGCSAGHNSSTGLSGSRNIILGAYSGGSVTTGSQNILIGYNVEPPSGTDSDKLNIGNTIYGDLSETKIGIGTPSPATSAILDLTSTTGALLLPRMTTAQRDTLTAVNGMVMYNSTLNKFQGYENGAWVSLI